MATTAQTSMVYQRRDSHVNAMRFTGENGEDICRWLDESGLSVSGRRTAFGANTGDAVVITGEDSGPLPEARGVAGGREERAWVGDWIVIEYGRVRKRSDENFNMRFVGVDV